MKTSVKIIAAAAALLFAAACVLGIIYLSGRARLTVLSDEEIAAVLEANGELDEPYSSITASAASLVGRVGYFWGGKSRASGWDEAWGVPRKVNSSGSSTTGTTRPYGLDCSGFVTWVFLQAENSGDMYEAIGEGTWNQWKKSEPIAWSDIRVGDLVFQNEYPGASGNHVGICIGFYKDKPVFAHCSAAYNNVVVTTAGTLFKYARRPNALGYYESGVGMDLNAA